MPKTLGEWLHYQTLKWNMSGEAVKFEGRWHRVSAGADTRWTQCNRWISTPSVYAGWPHERRNPWWGTGGFDPENHTLCVDCFAEEIPILEALPR